MERLIPNKITVQSIKKYNVIVDIKEHATLNRCKLIIAGSRLLVSPEIDKIISDVLFSYDIEPNLVLCGGANGIDTIGEQWANKRHIPVREFPARWGAFGKIAGHMRNNEMADAGDVLLLIWDGQSTGSAQMKQAATQRGLTIIELVVEYENKDYMITSNDKVFNAIKNRITINNGHCPCVPNKDDDHLCPCLKMRTSGACCCGLYLER